MSKKVGYLSRKWLNKEDSPSTGNVVCFDGFTTWHGEETRNTFISISDCSWSVRLHKIEDDDISDFVDKLKLLRTEIDNFINYFDEKKTSDGTGEGTGK